VAEHYTIVDIQNDIEQGKKSFSTIVQNYLEKINTNKHLNAFLEVFEIEALSQANNLDQKKAEGLPLGKLHGLVIGIKDNICYKEHKVSAASRILEGFESVFSATVVERLLAEDAIIIGRLNCDEFAMGSSNENSAYGAVKNAIDVTRVPGGSSGGSAVAVQAGLCHASLGSDTGGSIRQPASFCGLVGLKPTYGRVSRHGLIAYASSFDQIGPFTTNIADAALIMEVIAGTDEFDSTAVKRPVEFYSQTNFQRKARVAVLHRTIDHKGLDKDVKDATTSFLQSLKDKGYEVEEVNFELIDYLIATYYVLSTAEASSNLSRYGGVHYGYRSPNATDMDSVYKKSRSEGFGKEVKNRIILGTFVLSSGYYDAYYTRAQKVRRMLTNQILEILKSYDFICMPTAPSVAFKIGEKSDDPLAMYLADIYTVLANLVGAPAISIPVANDPNGLPIGVQLIAGKFEEAKLLAFCKELGY
jgi:aspartyl-tRNA(Asn)/glutamyl-tRNA(Gln) amidotransferase subunit A